MMTPELMDHASSPDGTPITYWSSGQGSALVLMHGTGADRTRWRTVLPLLEPHVTVYAVNRRGRGGSGDAGAYALAREVEDVAAVVEVIATATGAPVDVLGHSYGAICVLEALRLTPHVRRAVLYEPPAVIDEHVYPPGVLDRLQEMLAADQRAEVLETFFREIVRMPEHEVMMLRSRPSWSARVAAAHTLPRELLAHVAYTFSPARFAGMTVPTLLLVGGNSPAFLRRSTDAVAAALPHVQVAVLAGQQHVAMDTAPTLFAGEVVRFLQEPLS